MSDVCQQQKKRQPIRRMRSIYQVHYGLRPREDEMTARPFVLPTESPEVHRYALQVAGHQTTKDTKYLGLLQCSNGRILKPILKESQKREVDFYERLASTKDPDLLELRKFTPQYYGVRQFAYNGHELEYIMLEDLTERMLEPCIMDVKIGKRTWDKFASAEKIASEESKYRRCKQEYCFCIPGYQVYRVDRGDLHKYGKDHGKRLHGHMVIAAIRNYLNAGCVGVEGGGGGGAEVSACRALVLQQVACLWALQRWASRARSLRLTSTSLLLVYDAARLRTCCTQNRSYKPIARRKSIHSTDSPTAGSNFSGQLGSKGPVYRKVNSVPLSPMSVARNYFSPPPPITSPWSEALERLNHNHSFEHNYENKLSKIKMNYRATLDQLCSEMPHPNPWGTVKLIDFAHAYFDDDEDNVDYNFKEGIDSLVQIFEMLLQETDDQVF
ncbi:PREDICTED: inositol polyphosphate multikinase [Papilio xuthus]|uniref:Kinase n=1 Tax=Papilio xuthus TaxID=66420 RepID=A0AAJ6ZSF0_PAPXU|nr:PREDICTED: inositol polyphosphate multikinase [Papilio xuthus]XP_013178342.1 PREDICTED: inositol polyphosphate multikinase [Papilio xuthus]